MGHGPGAPPLQRQPGLGAVERLDLFVPEGPTAWAGGSTYKPTMSWSLAANSGSLNSLKRLTRCGFKAVRSPDPLDRAQQAAGRRGTNLKGAPRWLYESVYCARGQAENLIKAPQATPRLRPDVVHPRHRRPVPAADPHRRLVWPMHTLRGPAPKTSFWRAAPVRPPSGSR
jgi:hypothetical protein